MMLLAACDRYEPGPDAVDVRVELQYDTSQGAYVEGSFSYIRVERPDGERLFERRLSELSGKGPTFHSTDHIRLDPGDYQLISFQRPCSGNCGSLDPPTDRCKRRIHVRGDRTLTVRITAQPGQNCNIDLVEGVQIA
jgi:hypothetical protein